MKKVFKIYKEGTTKEWIIIMIPVSEATEENIKFKIDKYLYLGYKIELIF